MSQKTIVVATWNVNSLRARAQHVEKFLKEECVDILLLQETKVTDEDFPKELFEDLGYNIATQGQKSYNGVAIFSKFPLEDVQKTLPFLEEDLGARYISCFTGNLYVTSLYVPNGESVGHAKFEQKRIFYQALSTHLKQSLKDDKTPLLWGGDFNIAPNHADVYDTKLWCDRILCSREERTWFRGLLAEGLYDPLDEATHPTDKNPYTWWDYRTRGFDTGKGLRIDHMLLNPVAADLLEKAWVASHVRGWERPSDHAPVLVRLKCTRELT